MPKSIGSFTPEMRNIKSSDEFKEMREWTPDNSRCRLCKEYMQNIGFL